MSVLGAAHSGEVELAKTWVLRQPLRGVVFATGLTRQTVTWGSVESFYILLLCEFF